MMVQGSAANRSHGLTDAQINCILWAQSEGSDDETGETSISASKKVSYNVFQ